MQKQRRAPGLALAFLASISGSCGQDSAGATSAAPADPVEHGRALYAQSCAVCHDPGLLGAPKLPKMLADSRAWVAGYAANAAALEAQDQAHYAKNAAAIEAVLAAPEGPERYAAWLAAYLEAPRFDRPANRMNPLQLRRPDVEAIARYLETLP